MSHKECINRVCFEVLSRDNKYLLSVKLSSAWICRNTLIEPKEIVLRNGVKVLYLQTYFPDAKSNPSCITKLIRKLKPNNDEMDSRFAYPIAYLMARIIVDIILKEMKRIDFITYVPSHKNELRKDFDNRKRILSKRLATLVGEYLEKLLGKRISVQSFLDKTSDWKLKKFGPYEERLAIAKDLYKIKSSYAAYIKGSSVVLIDDVMTTGATLTICSDLLIKAGARKVIGLVAGKARRLKNVLKYG